MSSWTVPFTSVHLQHDCRIETRISIRMGGTGPMKAKGLLVFVCAVALTAGCNTNRNANRDTATTGTAANRDAGTTGTAGAGVSNGDKNFVNDQLSDGMAEVELAKVAKDHA